MIHHIVVHRSFHSTPDYPTMRVHFIYISLHWHYHLVSLVRESVRLLRLVTVALAEPQRDDLFASQ